MTQLFTRSGNPKEPNATINGRPAWTYRNPCNRCGGLGGSDAWKHTGWTCYRCGGSCFEAPRTDPLYTQEKLAQLNAAQAKRDAKKAEKLEAARLEEAYRVNANYDQVSKEFPEEFDWIKGNQEKSQFAKSLYFSILQYGPLSEKQLAAVQKIVAEDKKKVVTAATSGYFGKVGDKVKSLHLTPKVVIFLGYSQFGTTYRTIFEDDNGNVFTYKGSRPYRTAGEYSFTVKAHEEYKDVKQTVIQRPAVKSEDETQPEVRKVGFDSD